jgi:hypothetical protein
MSNNSKNSRNVLALEDIEGETDAEFLARAALRPAMNALLVIDTFKGNIMGKDVDMLAMLETLQNSMREVKGGDLTTLEAMLVGQATALQTIFTSMAVRASKQELLPQYQTFLGLALKAQAQSRATISALVDLKYPRQATFVGQANIAHGPQQVNNGTPHDARGQASRAKEETPEKSKLLEEPCHGSTNLDTRATPAASRSDRTMAAMGKVHRSKKRGG